MKTCSLVLRRTWALAIVMIALSPAAMAAPKIGNLSLRGLQAGGTTTLVVEGSQLAPDARVLLTVPGARTTIKPSSTPQRMELEVTLEPETPPGIYLLRVASADGISDAAAVSVDSLPQIPFAAEIATLNVAMSGSVTGNNVLSANFAGQKGQQVLFEVESRRLGSALNPSIHIYDSRRVQLAWSQDVASIAGDARASVTLPADGNYTLELHDALFRGGEPGFFRLKVGQFQYADLVFPLAVRQGTSAMFEFASTNLPGEARSAAAWPSLSGLAELERPAPWPANVPRISGARPVVLVSANPEVIEAPASDKPQELPSAPVAINGRLASSGEQDRFRLPVTPGQALRFDVLARRAGSPVDGVLSIQNEQGQELASNDDRPGNSDPGLDFTVPTGVTAIIVALRDLEGRGGPDAIYRISIEPIGTPDFSLSLSANGFQVPKDGAVLVRVRAARAGYNGPIKLNVANLPQGVVVSGDEIPSGVSEVLVTLGAPGLAPLQSLATISGSSTEPNTGLRRLALPATDQITRHQPWLRDEVAVAVTAPAPLSLAWEPFSGDAKLVQGTSLPIKLRVERVGGAAGAVRLSLVTTQTMPRKKVKVNNQDREVDDVDRALRFEAAPTIAADKNEAEAKILVPADLPPFAYDLAIQAELLGANNSNVVATAVTPARRLAAVAPISLELASQSPIEARAGVGPTGKLTGKVHRIAGFSLPVAVTLVGLPAGATSPVSVVPGDKADFEFSLSLPYGTPAGDLPNCKLVASAQGDPKNPATLIRANEIPLAIKVVPGEKPPSEKPLTIFEDQSEFVASLTQGNGQASLASDDKYSGTASIKITPDQRYNPTLPGLGVKIREKPGPGEFRYLQFAWKKQGGQAICLQLNHDGQWGPTEGKPAKFRYHAGPGAECFGASVAIDVALPSGFVLVTRDLFADFGEFTLTGLALSPVDGDYALFDHIYLGASSEDFEQVKP